MTAALAIAPLEPGFSEWESLLALIRAAFAPMDGIIDPPSSSHRLTPTSLEERARQERVLLAREDGRLAGCLFAADRGGHLYLGKLAVSPERQGCGIGRRLIESAERIAREAGKTALELQTRVELVANQEAFRRLGFVETARTAHPGFSRPTSITFRKPLP